MKRCKKLFEVPVVVTEWQKEAWCPDCEHYDLGRCQNSARTGSASGCPLDGKPLPLREIAVEATCEPCRMPANSRTPIPVPPHCAGLKEAIVQQVRQRTGRRIQNLSVEVREKSVVVRGCASCFYLKQLALLAVLEVAGSARTIHLELNVADPEPSTVDHGCDAAEIDPTQN